MQPYQQRVYDEYEQLFEKFGNLGNFLDHENSFKLDIIDRNLLVEQYMAMEEYLYILSARIERFKNTL